MSRAVDRIEEKKSESASPSSSFSSLKNEFSEIKKQRSDDASAERNPTGTRRDRTFSEVERRHVRATFLSDSSNERSFCFSLEERRKLIEDFKIKRDEAQNWKKITDRCDRQVQVGSSANERTNVRTVFLVLLQHLQNFIEKRKERFGIIADQHQYLLRHKFKSLMEKHRFEDCQIRIDHKKEELEIQVSGRETNEFSPSLRLSNRSNRINEVSRRYPVVNDRSPPFVFFSPFGNRFISRFVCWMKSIFTW